MYQNILDPQPQGFKYLNLGPGGGGDGPHLQVILCLARLLRELRFFPLREDFL